MRSPIRLAAAVLLGLEVAAPAAPARAQVALERAPLQVASPSPPRELPAQLGHVDSGSVFVGSFLAAVTLTDVGFGVYDGVRAARGERSPTGVGVGEAVFVAPQAVVFGTAHAVFTADAPDDDTLTAATVLVPAFTYSMLVHDLASEKLPTARTGVLYGVSWAAGLDLAFTVPALAAAGKHRLFPRALGAMEVALTVPQIAVASYGLLKDPGNTAGWAALAGCSSALFVHGLLSAAIPRRQPPVALPAAEAPRRPLQVPFSIDVGPAPVRGGGGIGVMGRWG